MFSAASSLRREVTIMVPKYTLRRTLVPTQQSRASGEEDRPLLSREEIVRFRRAVGASGIPRDRALFALIYRFGLRASEVSRLRASDVDLAQGLISIRRWRSSAPSVYPLPPDVDRALERYLARRETDS